MDTLGFGKEDGSRTSEATDEGRGIWYLLGSAVQDKENSCHNITTCEHAATVGGFYGER
jgi:hypothetical protein